MTSRDYALSAWVEIRTTRVDGDTAVRIIEDRIEHALKEAGKGRRRGKKAVKLTAVTAPNCPRCGRNVYVCSDSGCS